MDKEAIIDKIMEKPNYAGLVRSDVEKVYDKLSKKFNDEESLVKEARYLLRVGFSGFSGKRLFNWNDKTAEEILKKHLSTRERFEHYEEIYGRLLKNFPEKISVIDLGAGVNGFSYNYFEKVGKKVDYLGIEAVGQLVDLMKEYFEKREIKSAKAIHASLFETEKIKSLIEKERKPRVLFLFKVVDSLEKIERDYTKILLKEIVPLADKAVISFATKSWARRKKFFVNRKWLIDFIRENWQFTDDFEIEGERYVVFENNP